MSFSVYLFHMPIYTYIYINIYKYLKMSGPPDWSAGVLRKTELNKVFDI